MLTKEQKEFRKTHFMASDTARTLTGLFGGLYGVCAEKIHGVEFEGSEATDIGNALQTPILRFAAEQNSEDGIFAVPEDAVCASDELIAAHCDAYWVIANDDLIPVEAKSAGFASDYSDLDGWGEAGTSDIPDYPLYQLHHQMICCEAPRGYVVAWIRGRGKLLYRIERSEPLCKTIIELAHFVWDKYIAPGKLPEPTEETAPLALRAMQHIERTSGLRIPATLALRNSCAFYEKVRAARLAAEKVEDHCRALILYAMGDAEEADLGDELLTLKRIENAGYTKVIEPYSYVKIDIKPHRKELSNGRRTKQLTSQS